MAPTRQEQLGRWPVLAVQRTSQPIQTYHGGRDVAVSSGARRREQTPRRAARKGSWQRVVDVVPRVEHAAQQQQQREQQQRSASAGAGAAASRLVGAVARPAAGRRSLCAEPRPGAWQYARVGSRARAGPQSGAHRLQRATMTSAVVPLPDGRLAAEQPEDLHRQEDVLAGARRSRAHRLTRPPPPTSASGPEHERGDGAGARATSASAGARAARAATGPTARAPTPCSRSQGRARRRPIPPVPRWASSTAHTQRTAPSSSSGCPSSSARR